MIPGTGPAPIGDRDRGADPAASDDGSDDGGARRDGLALARSLGALALGTLALTWTIRLAIEHAMGVPLWHDFWARDYGGNLAGALLAWLLTRHAGRALALAGPILAGLQLISANKLRVLGVPGAPEDFANLANLWHLAHGPEKLAVAAVAVVPVALLLALVRWRSAFTWGALAALGAGVALLAANASSAVGALDARFGHSEWNAAGNFRSRGLVLHLVQESLRGAPTVGDLPGEDEVREALAGLPAAAPVLPAGLDRNVHVIVLESFFDLASLGPELVPEDPFPPALRALWDETGRSTALVPTFGGYTANAEFEALCGFPVVEDRVFFEGGLLREAPCLPRVLAGAGYRTVASHPNVPQFWNRTVAYRLAGFERFLSLRDFDTRDSVDSFLLDGSLYEQVASHLEAERATGTPERPVFDYVLTYHGHLPYPSSEAYPDRVATLSDAPPMLAGYANQLWYKSRDLVARIERLRADDPDALIVAFGDHLPFLDFSHGVYAEALGLPTERARFSAGQLEFLSATPLIVIDGQRGPLEVGRLALHRLPALILELLGASSVGAFDWAASSEGVLRRPLHGRLLETAADGPAPDLVSARAPAGSGSPRVCTPDAVPVERGCAPGLAWLARVRVLIEDLFGGLGHARDHGGPAAPGQPPGGASSSS